MDQKTWYTSKTIWGGIVTLLSVLLSVFGYDVSAEDQAQLSNLIISIVTVVAGAVGGILAIVGRIKATRPIGKG